MQILYIPKHCNIVDFSLIYVFGLLSKFFRNWNWSLLVVGNCYADSGSSIRSYTVMFYICLIAYTVEQHLVYTCSIQDADN